MSRKVVIITSKEASGGNIAIIAYEKDLWALEILVLRAGEKVVKITEAP